MATNDTVTAKQHQAIAALMTEPTIAAAATKLGIGERTLHRWLIEPEFAEAYRQARRLAVSRAISRLQHVCDAAVNVLLQVAGDRKTPPSTRVMAASKIIDYSLRSQEVEDLEARIAALEARAGEGR